MQVDVSLDDGQTWVRRGPIPMDGNPLHPSLVLLTNKALVAYMRSATQYDLHSGKQVQPYRHPTKRKVIVNPGHTFVMVSVCSAFNKILEAVWAAMDTSVSTNGTQNLQLGDLSECWSKAKPIPLPSPNAGLDAVLLGKSFHIVTSLLS